MEVVFNSITYFMFVDGQGATAAWYLASDAVSGFTFTGDTHTNTTIDNVSSLTGLYVGQLLSGTGIAANTRIATITSPSTITTTLATTATNAGVTITRTGLAKIIDADFPASIIGGFAEMDGYLFIATPAGRIYNSDLNSVSSWSANNYISSGVETDQLRSVIRFKNMILGMGVNSIEFYQNSGNPSGSILSRISNMTISGVGVRNGVPPMACVQEDKLYFISTKLAVYVFDGSLRQISSALDSVFNGTAPYGIYPLNMAQENFIYTSDATSGSANSQLFSVKTGEWSSFSYAYPLYMSFDGNGVYAVPATQSVTGGIIYQIVDAPTYIFQDNGVAIQLAIQTEPKVLNNGKGFKINSIELLADTQSSGATTLEISRDDYGSFQTLGSFPLTNNRKRITRGGYCRNHAIFRLTDSGNQAWRGQAIVVDWEPCTV